MLTCFHGWRRKIGVMALVTALALTGLWMSGFFVESRPIKTDRPGEDDAIADVGSDDTPVDWTNCERVFVERDPTTGSRFFSIDGSPVQGTLKAYLEDAAARGGGNLRWLKSHPDGEPCTWVEIPTPLFLSLTDQSPAS